MNGCHHLTYPFVVCTGVLTIAMGYWDTCALLINSSIYCWGDNYYGELGSGPANQSYTPVEVVPAYLGTSMCACACAVPCYMLMFSPSKPGLHTMFVSVQSSTSLILTRFLPCAALIRSNCHSSWIHAYVCCGDSWRRLLLGLQQVWAAGDRQH